MRLYGFAASPNTWKVRAVAHHMGLPLEYVHVDLMKGEQRAPTYLEISPTGRTPALVDGRFSLTESNAIMHYLAGKKPTSLLPDDPARRAQVLQWQCFQMEHWGKEACEPLIQENLLKPMMGGGDPDAAVVARATKAFHREAAMLEAHLEGRSHIVGDTLTLADLSVAASIAYAEQARIPVGDYPRIQAWAKRVLSSPAWLAVAPAPAKATG